MQVLRAAALRDDDGINQVKEGRSRYGGLKQIDPVDEYGNIIIDFSIFDAKQAGFEKVIFIIKKAIETEFKIHIGNRISRYMDVAYVYQEVDKIPEGFEVPEGRPCSAVL